MTAPSMPTLGTVAIRVLDHEIAGLYPDFAL
jgi:hypothetical protein